MAKPSSKATGGDQAKPLMPHATATWLIDNTSLGFEQISEFCGLHILEVQAMADDLAGSKYTGRDPLHSGELTQEEIDRGQADPNYLLVMQKAPVDVTRTKGPRYTPVSKRQDKPDGIAWLLRNHPEISDAQIGKLIGTTRNTIGAIRDRSHWNIQNIQPKDPVTLGLCSQRELDQIVAQGGEEHSPARSGRRRGGTGNRTRSGQCRHVRSRETHRGTARRARSRRKGIGRSRAGSRSRSLARSEAIGRGRDRRAQSA